jgi:4-aminobutyrate aminotransferase-like enzyme
MKSKSKRVLDLLRACESPNMLWIEPDGSWPIVWERAKGTRVWDADGKQYLDLTAAFGVAAAGHANPRVVAAGQRQIEFAAARDGGCASARAQGGTGPRIEPPHF